MDRSIIWLKRVICVFIVSLSLAAPVFAQEEVRVEEVRIEGPEVTIAGALYIPDTCAMGCPAMVFIGGGSAATRANQVPFAERFARKGIVSLIFDKRGAGESTGDYEARTFDNLADDAVLALQYLIPS